MSILHICQSDMSGGAAIAARRLVIAERAAGLDARMLVMDQRGNDEFTERAGGAVMALRVRAVRMAAKRIASMAARSDRSGMRSVAMLPTGFGRAIRQRNPDIVHWHWVGAEVISLAEMASVGAPSVWTCHDQWAFCGAEHYAPDRRFVDGYRDSLTADLDALTFRRKQRAWADWHPTLICPSEWMAQEARASALMGDASAGSEAILTIPNTLDTAVFAPQLQADARNRFSLPKDAQIVLFGADNGLTDPRKGFDLLTAALEMIPTKKKADMVLVTFGGAQPANGAMAGFRHIEIGRLSAAEELAMLYSAADVFVAPSRQDNLPNTLVEAQACGLPCVGFEIGGMGDIVAKGAHGTLVPPFEIASLAAAIQQVAAMPRDQAGIHRDAVTRFGWESVVAQHRMLYEDLLGHTGEDL